MKFYLASRPWDGCAPGSRRKLSNLIFSMSPELEWACFPRSWSTLGEQRVVFVCECFFLHPPVANVKKVKSNSSIAIHSVVFFFDFVHDQSEPAPSLPLKFTATSKPVCCCTHKSPNKKFPIIFTIRASYWSILSDFAPT